MFHFHGDLIGAGNNGNTNERDDDEEDDDDVVAELERVIASTSTASSSIPAVNPLSGNFQSFLDTPFKKIANNFFLLLYLL